MTDTFTEAAGERCLSKQWGEDAFFWVKWEETKTGFSEAEMLKLSITAQVKGSWDIVWENEIPITHQTSPYFLQLRNTQPLSHKTCHHPKHPVELIILVQLYI